MILWRLTIDSPATPDELAARIAANVSPLTFRNVLDPEWSGNDFDKPASLRGSAGARSFDIVVYRRSPWRLPHARGTIRGTSSGSSVDVVITVSNLRWPRISSSPSRLRP